MELNETLKKELLDIICEVTGIDRSRVEGHENLVDDLGVESIMIVDILSNVEEKYKITIPEDRYEDLDCLNSMAEVIDEIIKEG